MKHTFTNSSQVESVQFDRDTYRTTGTMTVTFKGGAQYAYFDVPDKTFDEFTKAESAGKFMNAKVKPFFKYAKIQP